MAARRKASNRVVILIDAPLPRASLDAVRRLSKRIELIEKPTPADFARANVIYTSAGDFDPANSPALRFVQVDTAAVNGIMKKPLAKAGVPIANISGAYSPAVAEFTITLLLMLTRKLDLLHREQLAHRWLEVYPPAQGVNLYGKTLGIVGYGSIGRQIARIAHAMGMTILACKRRPSQRRDDSFALPDTGDAAGKLPKKWFGIGQIRAMFAKCDAVIVTLPYTKKTHGIIGERELAALPPQAYFLNIGRGGTVDEHALAAALRERRLAGAALDVFVNEPLEAESPLWHAPNFLLVPHIASYTKEQEPLAGEVFLENLRRMLAGRPFINLVDLGQGY